MRETGDDLELHVLVHGQVQGVFFRQSTKDEAHRLKLSGWVRNLPDGETVEVLAQGPRKALQDILSFLGHGPPGAIVRRVEPEWRPLERPLDGFRIRS